MLLLCATLETQPACKDIVTAIQGVGEIDHSSSRGAFIVGISTPEVKCKGACREAAFQTERLVISSWDLDIPLGRNQLRTNNHDFILN